MSDKSDKPVDPDATVSIAPRKPAADADATVAMTSRDILKAPDDDATVRISARDLLKEPEPEPEPVDDDVTVTNLTREALMVPPVEPEPAPTAKPPADDDATVSIPPGGLKIAAEAAAAAAAASAAPAAQPAKPATVPPSGGIMGTSPASIAAEPSRMPMIAGGIVVVLVALYLMFGGDATTPPEKSKTPETPPPQASAPAAPPAAPSPASSSAPSAPAAPAASAPAAPAATAPTAPVAAPVAVPAPPVAGKPSVKELLAADIKRGTVALQEDGGVTTITIPMSHQFASGGTEPEPKLRPVLLGIAAALDKTSGAIVVTGHADSSPSSNPKFPSNEALSAARGAAAAKLMAGKLRDPKRISSEGAADSKPLVPSDTAENRAKNRRVVIVLKPAA